MTIQELREKCEPYMNVSNSSKSGKFNQKDWDCIHELYLASCQVKPDEKEAYECFWQLNDYVAGSYDVRRDFELLNQEICKKEKNAAANRLFYLALPPSVFEPVTSNLQHTCMATRYFELNIMQMIDYTRILGIPSSSL